MENPRTSNHNAKSMAHAFLGNLTSLLVSQGMLAVLSIGIISVLTRWLDPTQYGIYGLFAGVAGLFSTFGVAWILQGVYKLATEEFTEKSHMGEALATGASLLAALLAASTLILMPLRAWLLPYVGIRAAWFPIFPLYIGIFAFVTLGNYLFQACGKFQRYALLPPLERLIFFALISVAFFLRGPAQAETALVTVMISNSFLLALIFPLLGRSTLAPARWNAALAQRMIRFSAPFILTNLILYVAGWLDVYWVNSTLHKKDVGIYFLAVQFLNLGTQVPLMLNSLFTPLFIALQKDERQDLVHAFFSGVAPKLLFGAALALGAGSVALRFLFPFVVDAEFFASLRPALFFLAAVHSGVLYYLIVPLLFAREKTLRITILSLLSLLVSVPLYGLAIPRFGILGATASRVAQAAAASLVGLWLARFDNATTIRRLILTFLLGQTLLITFAALPSASTALVFLLSVSVAIFIIGRTRGFFDAQDLALLAQIRMPSVLLRSLHFLAKPKAA